MRADQFKFSLLYIEGADENSKIRSLIIKNRHYKEFADFFFQSLNHDKEGISNL